MRRLAAMMLLGCCALLALAQTDRDRHADWVVPEKAAQQKNPLANKPEAAVGGKRLFERNCTSCHGDEKGERHNGAPDLGSVDVQDQTDGALFWRITNGNSRTKMPSFSSLPEGQRWQLVLYIRELGKQARK